MPRSALYILFFILCLFPFAALAGAPVIYHDGARDSREAQVAAYLAGHSLLDPAAPYEIAAIDLNGDGVAEWIVTQPQNAGCAARADCRFVIAGLSDKSPVVLGRFAARKIGIAGEKAYGVLKLILYNDKNDDFAGRLYAWNPITASFTSQ